MSMFSMNFRIIPNGCYVEIENEFWNVKGESSIEKDAFIDYLVDSGIDILVDSELKDEHMSRYLINQGIEMQLITFQGKIRCIEFRICLSWYEEAINELYDILRILLKKYELFDWITNDSGEKIDELEVFKDNHIRYDKLKIEVFKRKYTKNIRLTEGEFYHYSKHHYLKFKRELKRYKKIR